jgi:5-aminopentanamidase
VEISAAACQLEPIYGELTKSIAEVKQALARAESDGVDILCLPECFLTGYFRDPIEAAENSISLNSPLFESILGDLSGFEPLLIVGLIERDKAGLFNAAVVIEKGRLLGRYRKRHLLEPAFQPGTESPIFERNGLKFGINICYDANFPDGAQELREHGAALIFYLLNNSLPLITARKWRHRHISNLTARAKECSVTIVSSDVVESSHSRIGYGFTTAIDHRGVIVDRVEELQVGRACLQLPMTAAAI